jgi:predicted esterase
MLPRLLRVRRPAIASGYASIVLGIAAVGAVAVIEARGAQAGAPPPAATPGQPAGAAAGAPKDTAMAPSNAGAAGAAAAGSQASPAPSRNAAPPQAASPGQAQVPSPGQAQAPPANRPAGGGVRSFALNVAGGSGGGQYPEGSVVHVWADPAPAGSVFDRWTGNLEPLIDRYAGHTTLVMPGANVAIRAVFKRAPSCVPQTLAVSGVQVIHCVPAGQTAVILLFHARGGAGNNYFRNAEALQFVADAAAAGFALVALDSRDRERKVWQLDARGESPDLQDVRAALDALVQRRLISRGEPVYALGIGEGGNFAAHVAQRLPCKAAAIFFAPGNLPPDFAVPTIWLMMQNEVNRQPRPLAEYTRLTRRQIPAKFEVNDPSPVYPLRFRHIRGVDAPTSQAIYRYLKQKGYLDAKDMLVQDPESSGWETGLPQPFARYLGAIREQLDVCFGLPRFFSDFDNHILDFFNEHR